MNGGSKQITRVSRVAPRRVYVLIALAVIALLLLVDLLVTVTAP
jgi:hypothetical protein